MNIYNGVFTHTRHYAHMVVVSNGGTANIYGGKFLNTNSALSALSVSGLYGFFISQGKNTNTNKNSEININGGVFEAKTVSNSPHKDSTFTPYLLNTDNYGVINITDGTFYADNYGLSKWSFDRVKITGGTFNTDTLLMNDDNTINLATKIGEDYRLKTVSEGKKVVALFKIGDKAYSSLTKALNEESNDDTIVVLEDSELDETYTINENKKITLDLNGHTLDMKKRS